MLIILLSCLLILSTSAQSIHIGRCPDVNVVQSLDVNKYTGVWYEYERSFPNPFEFAGKCVTANYTMGENDTIIVVNSQISSITGKPSSIKGTAEVDDAACGNSTGCGKLIVKFPVPIVGQVKGTYWVLDTDYTTYSAVWSCTDYYLFHTVYAWVLTREQNPTQAVLDTARNVFLENNVDWIYMTKTDQENCS
ncbi:apolipoprotein D-like [Chelonus insularis]|uniref:apolipoprotein D-like n=1 Tax=Chelonus insularis TaxID=460826 RepID=UPI00158AE1A1|nr:apolipoprotein D-like [Chelonus insularis]